MYYLQTLSHLIAIAFLICIPSAILYTCVMYRNISTLLSCLVQHVITWDSGTQTLLVHGTLSASTNFAAPTGQKKYLTLPFLK